MRRLNRLAIAALVAVSVSAGCASEHKTVHTETIEQPASSTRANDAPDVVQRTTETTETDHDSSGGVLSTTVDFIGEVIALPFRLVAGVIRAIF